MTLVLAIGNNAGAVIAADGVTSFGATAGAQQLPTGKLWTVGDRCVAGEFGNATVSKGMLQALLSSELAAEPTLSRSSADWLLIARQTVAESSRQYLANVVWNSQLPLQSQFVDTGLVIAGTAGDGTFAWSILWTGEHSAAEQTHYLARGSGAQTARIYLDAFSYFDTSRHPVRGLQALAARVMDRVSRNNIEIGGEISIVTVHRDVSREHPQPIEAAQLADPAIQGALQHWQLAEDAKNTALLQYVNPTNE